MPAINFGLFYDANDDDANTTPLDMVRIREAWDIARAASANRVGDAHVKIAVVDGGMFYTSPGMSPVRNDDLTPNIWINQRELPLALFDGDGDGAISAAEIAAHDCEPAGSPDGLITFRDLACAPAIQPSDRPPTGLDAGDLLYDPRWANGVDEDGNNHPDDLIGWDFAYDPLLDPPRPQHDPRDEDDFAGGFHGTHVATVIGGEGDNGTGIAGIVWRASLIPLRVTIPADPPFALHESISDAITYIEQPGDIDVVNISGGWQFGSDGLDRRCGYFGDMPNPQISADINQKVFDAEKEEAVAAYRDLFDGSSSHALYVLAAGNGRHFIDDAQMFGVPQESIAAAVPDRTLLVGAVVQGAAGPEQWVAADGPGTNYGPAVGIWAPTGWAVPVVGGGTTVRLGTSFSAPVVTGAAALLASLDPSYRSNGEALATAIRSTASPVLTTGCIGSHTFESQPLIDVARLVGAQ